MTPAKLLIIEDETGLAQGLKFNLEAEGYSVEVSPTGEDGLRRFGSTDFDLIILDIMLPGMDGFEVARKIRSHDGMIPIFMLTARVSDRDRIQGFESGAEDYLTKPFNLKELLLRIKALLRRSRLSKTESPQRAVIGEAVIDFSKGIVTNGNQTQLLTSHETILLQYLLSNPDRIVPREELLANVWGYSPEIETRTIDAFISKLRKKIEAKQSKPKHILSVRGIGYYLNLTGK